MCVARTARLHSPVAFLNRMPPRKRTLQLQVRLQPTTVQMLWLRCLHTTEIRQTNSQCRSRSDHIFTTNCIHLGRSSNKKVNILTCVLPGLQGSARLATCNQGEGIPPTTSDHSICGGEHKQHRIRRHPIGSTHTKNLDKGAIREDRARVGDAANWLLQDVEC